MKKLLAIGEALIDFIPAQRDCLLKEVEQFTRVCGGAPANVAAAAAKLGGDSSLISQLGRDAFGDYIVDTLADAGVDTSKICRTDRANTALAFVSLKADGNRDFSFYRKPSADMLLEPEQLDLVLVPCTAFDADCFRVGMGKGYYDRYLPRCTKAAKIGIALEVQRVPRAAVDAHDQRLDAFVTERGIYTWK